MFDRELMSELILFIQNLDGINDKTSLSNKVQTKFGLIRDRSVYYCDNFAIRFSRAKNRNFGNTVLSLSTLQKFDSLPFIVCLVTPDINYLMLANTTFLKKISHSSQTLRTNNIKGSFNGSDIMVKYEDIDNIASNFEFLFTSHQNFTFNENLLRLVEATNNIQPTGRRFVPTEEQLSYINHSIERAISFLSSKEYSILDDDLRRRVDAVSSEITIAAFIDNVNLRGRIIEYLITSTTDLRETLANALRSSSPLPEIYTSDDLGDYEYMFEEFNTVTDIKTKVLFLSSNPKGYNIDKLLSFLSNDKSVYLIYIVAIDENKQLLTRLCSMYNNQILNGTRILTHWAGRNSRGVTQYDGIALENAVTNFDNEIDRDKSIAFLERCMSDN